MTGELDLGLPSREVEPSDSDERYTTSDTLAWCAKKVGIERFDLDASATSESACAENFFTRAQDGLHARWYGNVWNNPPWSEIEPWVAKATTEIIRPEVKLVAQLLPVRTEQRWWQFWVEEFRDGRGPTPGRLTTHFLPGRTKYGHPGNRQAVGVGQPNFWSVLLVWRNLKR
jgi:phage N-6-adenine-methyltransferase